MRVIRWIIALLFLTPAVLVGQDCSKYDSSKFFADTGTGYELHITGQHSYIGQANGQCGYTGTYGVCDADVSVTASLGEPSMSESGLVSTSCHKDTTASLNAFAANKGAVSATATQVGGATACLFCACGFTVTLPPVTFSQTPIFQHTSSFTYSCPSKSFFPTPTCCDTLNCSARYTCNASCACQFSSPIIIDIEGEGFHLTSAKDGVDFDIGALGYKQHGVAWTDAKYHNAFLALDRNNDGEINDAKELFGSATLQPKNADPNGFLALAVYDQPENGGNGDGVIDSRDAIWPKLRLWIDENHDGISQPNELVRLEDEGVYSIGLNYTLTPRKDNFGNEFVYRGHVNARRKLQGDEVNRTIYDVILMLDHPGKPNCHAPKGGAQLLMDEASTSDFAGDHRLQ